MQSTVKTVLQRRDSTVFLNLINLLVTANTFFLSCFSTIRAIHRFHVKSDIEDSKHFDIFYPNLQKNNIANLKRNGLWSPLDTNNSEINVCCILITTFADDVLCKAVLRFG